MDVLCTGSRVQCGVRAANREGRSGQQLFSKAITIGATGPCESRAPGTYGADPFTARMRYTGKPHFIYIYIFIFISLSIYISIIMCIFILIFIYHASIVIDLYLFSHVLVQEKRKCENVLWLLSIICWSSSWYHSVPIRWLSNGWYYLYVSWTQISQSVHKRKLLTSSKSKKRLSNIERKD